VAIRFNLVRFMQAKDKALRYSNPITTPEGAMR
jgi:hypothetical protein